MKIHVHTSVTSNTGKCTEAIDAAVEQVKEFQNTFLTPAGFVTVSKETQRGMRVWFSHTYVPKNVGRMVIRHPNDRKTPLIVFSIDDYISALNTYNNGITGDCQVEAYWTLG